ncbi:MAG: hypothetical protein ACO3RV_03950 [Luteolibacter sp.]
MQRPILIAAIVLVLAALTGGGIYGLHQYRQSRPTPMWVPVPINPEIEHAKIMEAVKVIEDHLSQPEILAAVSRDMQLTRLWNLPSDDACAAELKARLFVRSGDMATGTGTVPAIHVGLNGKRREKELTGKIAVRMMDDVKEVLGIESSD